MSNVHDTNSSVEAAPKNCSGMGNKQRRITFAFLIATFLISWSLWCAGLWGANLTVSLRFLGWHAIFQTKDALSWLGNFGPGLVALLFVNLRPDSNFPNPFRSLLNWKLPYRSFALALGIPALVGALAFWAVRARFPSAGTAGRYLAETVVNLPLAALWEETGWRGFLLPRFQLNRTSLRATLILGPIWAIWHLPLRLYSGPPGTPPFVFFAIFSLYICGAAIILTWLYNLAWGSLIPVVIFHAGLGTSTHLLVEPTMAASGIVPFIWTTAIVWIIALAIIVISGSDLGRTEPQTLSRRVEP